MASLKGVVAATCPQGCGEFETEVWSLIRADEDPELKDTILGGELNLVLCPDCGKLFYCPASVIYLDPPVDLAVFVFPEDADRSTIEEKIKEEFALVKEGLLKELKMHSEPVIFFGVEPLKEFLDNEQFLRDEGDITGYAATELGLKTMGLRPALARENGWPYRIPAEQGTVSAKSVLSACEKVLAVYKNLARLEKFRAALAKDPKLAKELI